ncbi:MAG: TonB-dependent receptor [Ignavibacteriae bacterium HGW-Ignavibacteriae-1]|jgi:outer membrane receptor protein involved in Fe transport|nr:MAG: TonB-dependent receptor [Ignavibacteriae bacterium HGW-Ignavibacteriae-1]
MNTGHKITTILSLLLIINSFSLAQTSKEIDSTEIKRYKIEDVTIMAPKDAMSIQLLPSSITLIEANMISDNGIRSLKDISSIAPNFFMPEYGSKLTSPVYIRGIGSRINSPSVGLNVDHVPFFEKAAFDLDLFDIERIEVLRGPQGTLYGRNTMGGIINVFTKSPLNTKGTELSLNAGSYGLLNAGANHYGALSRTFGYSLSMNYLSEDGFFVNKFDDSKVDDIQSIGSRLRLIHEPTDYFVFENITSFETSKQGAYPYAKYDKTSGVIADINYNERSTYDRNLLSNAFIFKLNSSKVELISTSSVQFMNDKNAIDQDFSDKSMFFVIQDQEHKMFSQEIILKSKGRSTYEWLVGAYGFYQGLENFVDVMTYSTNSRINREYYHDILGGALFHQSTLNDVLLEKLSITAGIRADYEYDELTYKAKVNTNNTLKQLADTLYPELTSFQLMPKFSIKYEFNYYTYVYTSISKGYKTGGFNTLFERPEDLTFDPEHSLNYEAGIKLNLFDGNLYTDFALFYIDWTNQQIYQTVPSGRGSMLKNAGSSTSKGVELSMRATPFDRFETSLTFGYTDARFDSYIVDTARSYSGNYIPYVPKFTMSLHASKTFVLGEGFFKGLRFNALYRITGKHYWTEANTTFQDTYGLLDGTISLITDVIDVDLWFRNILNQDYWAFYFEAAQLGNFVQHGKPQRLGVKLSAKF